MSEEITKGSDDSENLQNDMPDQVNESINAEASEISEATDVTLDAENETLEEGSESGGEQIGKAEDNFTEGEGQLQEKLGDAGAQISGFAKTAQHKAGEVLSEVGETLGEWKVLS